MENRLCDLFSALEEKRPLEPCEQQKINKALCYINGQIGLIQGFHYEISYKPNDHVIKKRISSRIYNLIFQTRSFLVNGKCIASKPYVYSKFDKFI